MCRGGEGQYGGYVLKNTTWQAAACVDESGHLALRLVNAGDGPGVIVAIVTSRPEEVGMKDSG